MGVVHFKLRDFHNSEKWLKIAANANNGVACFNLGNIYVSLNREEDAIEYYKKGHILGNNECKFNLAILYMKNNMEKEAVSLYKQLYKSGYEKGCYNLGLYWK